MSGPPGMNVIAIDSYELEVTIFWLSEWTYGYQRYTGILAPVSLLPVSREVVAEVETPVMNIPQIRCHSVVERLTV